MDLLVAVDMGPGPDAGGGSDGANSIAIGQDYSAQNGTVADTINPNNWDSGENIIAIDQDYSSWNSTLRDTIASKAVNNVDVPLHRKISPTR